MKTDVRTDPRQVATSTPPVGSSRRSALGALTAVSLVVLVILALFVAPEDATQGAAQRIFYIHVPSAWVGFLAFFVVFVASIRFLKTGVRRFDDLRPSVRGRRDGVHDGGADHRAVVGTTGVGRLLDVGSAA